MVNILKKIIIWLGFTLILSCSEEPWNNPYTNFSLTANSLYTAFTERPKHLDPALSYTEPENVINGQIYEPPLQYHYLKRPYALDPLIATQLPTIRYVDANDKPVSMDKAVYTTYTIQIQPNILYQPHPAFVKGKNKYLYHALSDEMTFTRLEDFPKSATRELTAQDFVYQIKRLADPSLNSPISELMSPHIVGFKDFSKHMSDYYQQHPNEKFVDLREHSLEGVKELDKYTYEIKLQGLYPQFIYWLAMPFFSPMPWEALKFYSQPILQKRNITLDWYPVGTGPFYLKENNPNLRMILQRNPYYHAAFYPNEGTVEDKQLGLLQNANKRLPFLDNIIFTLEKENIPYWRKFLQGYYDQAGVVSTNFDQALTNSQGEIKLSKSMQDKDIRLSQTVNASIFYWGINMLDPLLGGYSANKKKLRQALSLCLDLEEYINIFLNGNGEVAKSILPSTIWPWQPAQIKESASQRLQKAKNLLNEAGYPNGMDPKTKKPLVLFYDVPGGNGPDSQANLNWMRKQFKKLGIDLIIRASDFNRFQDKMATGTGQIYVLGWNADYPDPENFFFLLYGKNGRVKAQGENNSNYENKEFDALYEVMKNTLDENQRKPIIARMLAILEEDKPFIAGYHPVNYILRQSWINPLKPNVFARNTLKYISINPQMRKDFQIKYNQPYIKPLGYFFLLLGLLSLPAIMVYYRKIYYPNHLKKAAILPVEDNKC